MASSEYNKNYYKKNKERLLEKANIKYAENKDLMNLQRRKWYSENKEKQLECKKKWCEKNRHLVNSYAMKRHAAKKQRIPNWLDSDQIWMLEQAYEIAAIRTEITGIVFEVDHIVPLQGKNVSGLHVPWNIQVIPKIFNRKKSNTFEGA